MPRAAAGRRRTGRSAPGFSPLSKKFHVVSPSSDCGSSRKQARLPKGWSVRTSAVPAGTRRRALRAATSSVTGWCFWKAGCLVIFSTLYVSTSSSTASRSSSTAMPCRWRFSMTLSSAAGTRYACGRVTFSVGDVPPHVGHLVRLRLAGVDPAAVLLRFHEAKHLARPAQRGGLVPEDDLVRPRLAGVGQQLGDLLVVVGGVLEDRLHEDAGGLYAVLVTGVD